MRRWRFLWWTLVLSLLTACGASKTYLVEIKYVPQAPLSLRLQKARVGVAPFIDRRNSEHDVGMRRKLDGSLDRYTTAPTSVSEGIRKAVDRFLSRNNFQVIDLGEWDLQVASVSEIDTDLVVGGEINRFWSRADSMPGRTVIRAEVELVFYVGKPREGRVLQQKIEMTREITEIVFSEEKVEELLNETLSEIIEDAFAKLLAAAIENPGFQV
jgi:hypothetical protein